MASSSFSTLCTLDSPEKNTFCSQLIQFFTFLLDRCSIVVWCTWQSLLYLRIITVLDNRYFTWQSLLYLTIITVIDNHYFTWLTLYPRSDDGCVHLAKQGVLHHAGELWVSKQATRGAWGRLWCCLDITETWYRIVTTLTNDLSTTFATTQLKIGLIWFLL